MQLLTQGVTTLLEALRCLPEELLSISAVSYKNTTACVGYTVL